MRESWKTIASRVAKNLDLPEEYVLEQINLYTEELRDALRKHVKIEYDFFMLGKIKASSRKLKRIKKRGTYPSLQPYIDDLLAMQEAINTKGRQPNKTKKKK